MFLGLYKSDNFQIFRGDMLNPRYLLSGEDLNFGRGIIPPYFIPKVRAFATYHALDHPSISKILEVKAVQDCHTLTSLLRRILDLARTIRARARTTFVSWQRSTTGAPKALSRAEFIAERLYVFDEEGVMPASLSH